MNRGRRWWKVPQNLNKKVLLGREKEAAHHETCMFTFVPIKHKEKEQLQPFPHLHHARGLGGMVRGRRKCVGWLLRGKGSWGP